MMARRILFKNACLIDGISDQPQPGMSITVDVYRVTVTG